MPLIRIENIGVELNRRQVLEHVTLDVEKGDLVIFTGPNGGGKTTLLRIILGLLRPREGKVEWPEGRPAVGYLPQTTSIDPHFPLTVRNIVATGVPESRGRERAELTAKALERVGMEGMAKSPLSRLSGGQRQRTLLARALAGEPTLLVLDEPLSYLDAASVGMVVDVIRQAMERGETVLLVTHELEPFRALHPRIYTVERILKKE